MHDSQARGTVRKGSHLLTSIERWHRFAPPKRDNHWKDGRSAKENARAWVDAAPDLQPDVAQVLANCPDIGPLRRWHAEPEARIAIDRFRGEQPNIDLLLVAEDDRGPVVVAIEAKADEAFGDLLADQYRRADAARASNPRSKAINRIESLLDRFALDFEQRHVPQLRYQLLTATAAVLVEGQRRSAERTMLLVHEFVTPLTAPEKRERNVADLHRFLSTAFAHDGQLVPGGVVGPLRMDSAVSLYVGKARTVI